MKKAIFLFLFLVSFSLTYDFFAKTKLSEDFFTFGFGYNNYISQKNAVFLDFSLGKNEKLSFGLDASYRKEEEDFFWKLGVEDLFAEYTETSFLLGLIFPWGLSDLEAGLLTNDNRFIPYFTFSHHFGALLSFIRLSDKIMIGLNYGFDIEKKAKDDYFRMVFPLGEIETNRKNIVIKGYFLDAGKIFLNGEELSIRSDGMFIKPVELDNYGRNEFSIVMDGINIGRKKHDLVIYRSYPYYDLSVELQKDWEKIIDFAGYPKGDEFEPDKFVTKGDFYLVLGRLLGFQKMGYFFKEYFTDVLNPELKEYLDAFYGKGYIRTASTQIFPATPVFRQEALTVLSRLLPDEINIHTNYEFADVSTKDWFYLPVNKLANAEVLKSLIVNPKGNLTRMDFYSYLYEMRNNFELLKEDVQKKEVEVITPIIIESMPEKVDYSKFSFKDVNLIAPVKGERTESAVFYVKGFAPPGLKIMINNQAVLANRLGRFAGMVELFPGMNSITIGINNQVRDFYVLFQKKFEDLVVNNYENLLIEKVSTVTGYRIDKDNFEPDEFVSKEELILTLFDLGYFSKEKVEQLLATNEDKEEEEEYTIAEDAVTLFKLVTGSSYNPYWGQEFLTRKNLVLLLSEIPDFKQKINDFFEVKDTI